MPLQKDYYEKMVPKLMEEFDIANKMAVPRITKIVVNVGLKEALTNRGAVEKVAEQLTAITGQKPKLNKAKKSIANFKLREGDLIGLSVTLRGKKMWDFLTKLIGVVLPRVRDFHGIPVKSFDKAGNYSLGLADQTVFPEIDYSKIDKVRGLEITIGNNSGDVKIARGLLTHLGLPFAKE